MPGDTPWDAAYLAAAAEAAAAAALPEPTKTIVESISSQTYTIKKNQSQQKDFSDASLNMYSEVQHLSTEQDVVACHVYTLRTLRDLISTC